MLCPLWLCKSLLLGSRNRKRWQCDAFNIVGKLYSLCLRVKQLSEVFTPKYYFNPNAYKSSKFGNWLAHLWYSLCDFCYIILNGLVIGLPLTWRARLATERRRPKMEPQYFLCTNSFTTSARFFSLSTLWTHLALMRTLSMLCFKVLVIEGLGRALKNSSISFTFSIEANCEGKWRRYKPFAYVISDLN